MQDGKNSDLSMIHKRASISKRQISENNVYSDQGVGLKIIINRF